MKTKKEIIINGKPADDLTYEYRNGKYDVHGWGVWGAGSLEGQPLKKYLESFDSEEEVKSHYPEAQLSNPLLQPQNTFDHLPDAPDY